MSISLRGRTLPQIFVDTMRVYFSPIFKLKKRDLRLERLYYLRTGRREATIDAVSLVHDIASYNQAALIEFIFILAERHKNLRIAVERKNADLRPHLNAVVTLMNQKFFESISKNFGFLHRHFHGRSPHKPRLSVKGHWRTEDSEKIITIFRDGAHQFGDVFLLDDNSAISHCAKYGTPYLCNNIVRAVYQGSYNNQRIDVSAVQRLVSKSRLGGGLAALHRKWSSVWINQETSFYPFRSTLVVPIFVANEKLSEETRKRFDVGSSDRTIFGYLCFDHVEVDYFDWEIDVPVAEIVADILSIFAFQRIRFTDYSQTFQSAEARARVKDYLDQSTLSMEDILVNVRSALEGQETEKSGTEPTTHNTLLNADELLIRLLEESSRAGLSKKEVVHS